jgi:hypothetical protein
MVEAAGREFGRFSCVYHPQQNRKNGKAKSACAMVCRALRRPTNTNAQLAGRGVSGCSSYKPV